MKLINGKQLAQKIKDQIKHEVHHLDPDHRPGLAAILVGQDLASQLYVNLKKKACLYTGINFHEYLIEDDCPESTIIEAIEYLNNDQETNGILVQLPLPAKYNEEKIINAISPKKDVDGFHPKTLASLKSGKPNIISGLSLGIVRLIEETNENLANKKAVIICNSKVFSEPLVYLLKQKKVQTKVIAKTHRQLEQLCQDADIIIVAVGQAFFLSENLIKDNAIVIDVGTNKMTDGKIVGDVDAESTKDIKGWITPVPGGVGPMTVAMLLWNTLELYKKQTKA